MITRRFTIDDQLAFAALSGDWNPIHVDPLFARRTAAGAPVVHGIALLLHALEHVAQGAQGGGPIESLRVRFPRFVHVDEAVTLSVRADDAERLLLEWTGGGIVRAAILLRRGPRRAASVTPPPDGPGFDPGRTALALPAERLSDLTGIMPFAMPAPAWADAFPGAAAWLGAARIAAIGTSTRLVGMVCPGLHSVYLELLAALIDAPAAPSDALAFRMGPLRHGLIGGAIGGGGIDGAVKCLVRAPPAAQASLAQLSERVAPDAFAGDHALIVGGSRGLGEVAAKLLSAGGARVTLTYASGEAEAAALAAEIGAAGGTCDILRYRVEQPAAPQLAALAAAPSHVYYFATPSIARANSRFFDAARLGTLMAFYVDGFWALAAAIQARRPDARIFYPSSVYVEARPRGLAEYAMAKAAGEILCAELNATMAPLQVAVARLPQLATDQTLTSAGVAGGDPADALLPHLRALHAAAPGDHADPAAQRR